MDCKKSGLSLLPLINLIFLKSYLKILLLSNKMIFPECWLAFKFEVVLQLAFSLTFLLCLSLVLLFSLLNGPQSQKLLSFWHFSRCFEFETEFDHFADRRLNKWCSLVFYIVGAPPDGVASLAERGACHCPVHSLDNNLSFCLKQVCMSIFAKSCRKGGWEREQKGPQVMKTV